MRHSRWFWLVAAVLGKELDGARGRFTSIQKTVLSNISFLYSYRVVFVFVGCSA
jgi:hypothetical protein